MFKGHNSTKVCHKSVQWYPLSVFFFFSMLLHFGVFVVKHMELILKGLILRWLNRVMQDHEASASDLNRKLIFSFFLLFS